MVSRIGSAVAEIRTGARKQKRERVLQAAGEKQKVRPVSTMFQCQQPPRRKRARGRCIGLKLICRDEIEQSGTGRRMGHAGDNLDVEFEPLHHNENGPELAEHGEPAQPQYRVQTDIAAAGWRKSEAATSVIPGTQTVPSIEIPEGACLPARPSNRPQQSLNCARRRRQIRPAGAPRAARKIRTRPRPSLALMPRWPNERPA